MSDIIELTRQQLAARMAEWTDAPVYYEGMPRPEIGSPAWVRFSYRPTETRCGLIDASVHYDLIGMVGVQVFSPEADGDGPAWRLAESVAMHFREYVTGYLSCTEPKLTAQGASEGWLQIGVVIPWTTAKG